MNRANVELVSDWIAEVREGTYRRPDGTERPIDAIIYGTGFRNLGILTPLRIAGRDGRTLT